MNCPSRFRRVLRLAGWNALWLIAGLAMVALTGEAWLRSKVPFMTSSPYPQVFVPGVGLSLPPDTEIRSTNMLDFWTVSRTNRLGFLDREPPSPERAAKSCHIAMIGDSFVEARQVSIPEKFHVRLEEMAARELPHLDVTTSAFGIGATGQIDQLALYDEYARHLLPRLVVLVFVPNDYHNNFPLWRSILTGLDPEHLPYVSAVRAADGSFRLRPPDPDYERFRLPRLSGPPSTTPLRSFIYRIRAFPRSFYRIRAFRRSYFMVWLNSKRIQLFHNPDIAAYPQRIARMELLSRRPAYAPLLHELLLHEDIPSVFPFYFPLFQEGNILPFYKEALAFTAFGLDEFKERAERDGTALVILATHRMRISGGEGGFARMNEMAAERGIPVIDQGSFIYRQGTELRDAQWAHDSHWSPTGHQWAAEALLTYLKRNQGGCE